MITVLVIFYYENGNEKKTESRKVRKSEKTEREIDFLFGVF
jgi:hypothetical protein